MTDGKTGTVLVIDDNQAIADTYAAFLDDTYDVLVAYGGKSALEKLHDDVDVVLLDRRMPELHGDDVLEEIETRQFDCRVVMLTAVDPDFDILDMGIDDYLVKPVNRSEINGIVEEMLERSRYDDEFRKYLSLVSKKSALEREKSAADLETSDEYRQIKQRLEERKEDLGVDVSTLEESFDESEINPRE
jgi:DNA-binding response OmpR family regulator